MLYAILCYNSEAEVSAWSEAQAQAVLARRAAAQRSWAAQGQLGPVARLMPTTTATTVRAGRQPLVIDGPFAETKEALLGFYVIESDSLEALIETSRQMLGETGALEIRPLRTLRVGDLRAADLGGSAHSERGCSA